MKALLVLLFSMLLIGCAAERIQESDPGHDMSGNNPPPGAVDRAPPQTEAQEILDEIDSEIVGENELEIGEMI